MHLDVYVSGIEDNMIRGVVALVVHSVMSRRRRVEGPRGVIHNDFDVIVVEISGVEVETAL